MLVNLTDWKRTFSNITEFRAHFKYVLCVRISVWRDLNLENKLFKSVTRVRKLKQLFRNLSFQWFNWSKLVNRLCNSWVSGSNLRQWWQKVGVWHAVHTVQDDQFGGERLSAWDTEHSAGVCSRHPSDVTGKLRGRSGLCSGELNFCACSAFVVYSGYIALAIPR